MIATDTWEKTARILCHNFETNGRPYSSYILVRSFYNPNNVVALAAVFSIVTQRKVCGEERCVTTLKTAARETNNNAAKGGKSIKYRRSEFLAYQNTAAKRNAHEHKI